MLEFLQAPALQVAPLLLGCELERRVDGQMLRVKIVEVEAYDQTDPASHSFGGPSKRSQVMFGPAGHLYVYFTYGMHYCCNVVTGKEGYGSGLLIRAVEPLQGQDYMSLKRHGLTGKLLTNGPAKVTQALDIGKDFNGHDLLQEPLKLIEQPALPMSQIIQTTRIGISKSKELPHRFYIKDNPYVSKK